MIILPVQLDPTGSDGADAWRGATRKPWRRYSPAELWADGVVHALGLTLAAVGAVALLIAACDASGETAASAVAYLVSLGLCFAASAAYNLWPVSPWKWILRRLDQSAIYLLIAGTYTPFLVAMKAWGPLSAIWAVAILGIALRIWRPSKYDRLSLVLYLALGWSGVLMIGEVISRLPGLTPWLIAAGGVVYSLGVIFHVWEKLRFQNAIWHGFVLVAASIHYVAVWWTVTAAA